MAEDFLFLGEVVISAIVWFMVLTIASSLMATIGSHLPLVDGTHPTPFDESQSDLWGLIMILQDLPDRTVISMLFGLGTGIIHTSIRSR